MLEKKILVFSLGRGCNLSCQHCSVDAGPEYLSDFRRKDAVFFVDQVLRYRPQHLLFTGGEPTLYLDEMVSVIERCQDISLKYIGMTTNGLFLLRSDGSNILKRIPQLTYIQLSCGDLYNHAVKPAQIKAFSKVCQKHQVELLLRIPILKPEDILKYDEYLGIGVPVAFTKVVACGRAITNNIYFKTPRFDESVLSQKCSQDTIAYHGGKGFSICCGLLLYHTPYQIAHPTIEEHLGSRFYRMMAEKTFGALVEEAGISRNELTPFHSHPCHLCEFVFRKMNQKNSYD